MFLCFFGFKQILVHPDAHAGAQASPGLGSARLAQASRCRRHIAACIRVLGVSERVQHDNAALDTIGRAVRKLPTPRRSLVVRVATMSCSVERVRSQHRRVAVPKGRSSLLDPNVMMDLY